MPFARSLSLFISLASLSLSLSDRAFCKLYLYLFFFFSLSLSLFPSPLLILTHSYHMKPLRFLIRHNIHPRRKRPNTHKTEHARWNKHKILRLQCLPYLNEGMTRTYSEERSEAASSLVCFPLLLAEWACGFTALQPLCLRACLVERASSSWFPGENLRAKWPNLSTNSDPLRLRVQLQSRTQLRNGGLYRIFLSRLF